MSVRPCWLRGGTAFAGDKSCRRSRRSYQLTGQPGLADLPAARQRTIAVLGHEQAGIPPEAIDLLDVAVEIPMIGTSASLNVAVAGSLVLYRLAGFI
jgi:tRNA G18 (ribose-2'-O)-methylase SpoU